MEFRFCIFWNDENRKNTNARAATWKQLLFVNSFISIIPALWRRFLWITPINETHCTTKTQRTSEQEKLWWHGNRLVKDLPFHLPFIIGLIRSICVQMCVCVVCAHQSFVTVHSSIQFIFRISCYVILSIYISLNFAFVAIGIACVCGCECCSMCIRTIRMARVNATAVKY